LQNKLFKKNQKKIFLTGASGKLGSYLHPFLMKKFKVLVTGNKKKISYINKINLLNNSKLKKKLNNFNPDVIVHLAAITNVDLCEKNFNLAYKTNILITNNLVNWCLENNSKIKFVYISSDQVYNNKRINTEESKTDPLNIYALSKIISEDLVSQLTNSVILRTNFFGYFPGKDGSLIDWLIKMIKKKKKTKLIIDINFNPLYVETLCKLIKKIILKKGLKGIYNLGSKNKISKGMLLYKFAEKLGFKEDLFSFVSAKKINFFAPRPMNMYMSVKKIEKDLEIKMPSINDELNNLIDNLSQRNAI